MLSGGGSGHEPSQCGFVGHGMLSAAVSGSVFVSPPPASILEALRAIQSPAGSLMIVTNYTGSNIRIYYISVLIPCHSDHYFRLNSVAVCCISIITIVASCFSMSFER